MIDRYDFNIFKYLRLYMSEFQKQVERAFLELTKKYALPKPLLFSHNWILQCLHYQEAPISLTKITHEAGLSLPNVSVSVKALIEDGLVEQIEIDNKRVCAVKLTPFGREVCNDYVYNYLLKINEILYRGIAPEKHDEIKQFYVTIAKNIEQLHNHP